MARPDQPGDLQPQPGRVERAAVLGLVLSVTVLAVGLLALRDLGSGDTVGEVETLPEPTRSQTPTGPVVVPPFPAGSEVTALVAELEQVPPREVDLDRGHGELLDLVEAMAAGAPDLDQRAGRVGYRVVRLAAPSGEVVGVLPQAGSDRGWGSVFHRPGAPVSAVVGAPHTFTDLGSASFAAGLFDASGASWLLLAGARRDAEDGAWDAARGTRLPFHLIHEELLDDVALVVQVHGFDPAGHPDIEADVVVSGGAGELESVRGLHDALAAAGIPTCLAEGDACAALAGRRNAQGRAAASGSVPFLHLELAQGRRLDAEGRAQVLDLVAGWMVAR